MKKLFSKNKAVWALTSSLFLVLIFLVVDSVFAQTLDYTPLAPLPGIAQEEASNLALYLVAMFNLLIGVAAVLAVLMITIGGFQYMSTDAISGKEEGKERINNAIIGLFLAMGAWLFLYTINPKLIEFQFNVPIPEPIVVGTVGTSTPGIGTMTKYSFCHNVGVQQPRISEIEKYIFIIGNQNSRNVAQSQCERRSPQPGRLPDNPACTNYRDIVCTTDEIDIPDQNEIGWYKVSVCKETLETLHKIFIPLGRQESEQVCRTSAPVEGPVNPPRTGCVTETVVCEYSD